MPMSKSTHPIIKAFRYHFLAILAIFVYGLICNLVGLRDFSVQLPFWSDDNLAYYANRAIEHSQYTGDIWHNTFQDVYVLLSTPALLTTKLTEWFNADPVKISLVFTAIKVWLLTFVGYAIAYGITRKRFPSVLAAIGLNASYVVWWNLALFGYLRYMPYQSDLAYPLVLLAVYLLAKERRFAVLLILVVTGSIQPIIGLYGSFILLFIVVIEAWRHRKPLPYAFIGGIAAISLVSVLPSRMVLAQIPEGMMGDARVLYDALNKTHGAMWEWADRFNYRLTGLAGLSGLYLIASLAWPFKRNTLSRFLQLASLAAAALTAAGLAAKGLCMLLVESPGLKFMVPFHQILMTRASIFVLIIGFIFVSVYLVTRLTAGQPFARLAALLALLVWYNMSHTITWTGNPGLLALMHGMLFVVLAYDAARDRIQARLIEQNKRPATLLLLFDTLMSGLLFSVVFFLVIRQADSGVVSHAMFGKIFYAGLALGGLLMLSWSLQGRVLWIRVGLMAALAACAALVVYALLKPNGPALWSPQPVSVFLTLTYLIAPLLVSLDDLWFGLGNIFKRIDLSGRLRGFGGWLTGKSVSAASLPVLAVVGLTLIGSYQDARDMQVAPHSIRYNWYEAAKWAEENTPPGSSFLGLTEYTGDMNGKGWRTGSNRGWIRVLEYPVSLVYTPDLRFILFAQPMIDRLIQAHPGMSKLEIVSNLTDADLKYLSEYTGAEYALAPVGTWLNRTIVFMNESYAIYALNHDQHPNAAAACQQFNQQIAPYLSTGKNVVANELFCPLPAEVKTLRLQNHSLTVKDLFLNQPDLLIISSRYIDAEDAGPLYTQISQDPGSPLNYQRLFTVSYGTGKAERELNVYTRSGPRTLNAMLASASGTPRYPGNHDTAVLTYDGAIPADVYLVSQESYPLPHVLELNFKQPVELQGAGFLWYDRKNHPRSGALSFWNGEEMVFESDLTIQNEDGDSFSWVDLPENQPVDRMVLQVESFVGQARLLIRSLLVRTLDPPN
jgi:hypothetical protein